MTTFGEFKDVKRKGRTPIAAKSKTESPKKKVANLKHEDEDEEESEESDAINNEDDDNDNDDDDDENEKPVNDEKANDPNSSHSTNDAPRRVRLYLINNHVKNKVLFTLRNYLRTEYDEIVYLE